MTPDVRQLLEAALGAACLYIVFSASTGSAATLVGRSVRAWPVPSLPWKGLWPASAGGRRTLAALYGLAAIAPEVEVSYGLLVHPYPPLTRLVVASHFVADGLWLAYLTRCPRRIDG